LQHHYALEYITRPYVAGRHIDLGTSTAMSPSRIPCWFVPLILSVTILASTAAYGGHHHLSVSYYDKSCPSAQSIVQAVMASRVAADQAIAPAVLRLFFHDCFVNVRRPNFTEFLFRLILISTREGNGQQLLINE
jgi:hypothetical protein